MHEVLNHSLKVDFGIVVHITWCCSIQIILKAGTHLIDPLTLALSHRKKHTLLSIFQLIACIDLSY